MYTLDGPPCRSSQKAFERFKNFLLPLLPFKRNERLLKVKDKVTPTGLKASFKAVLSNPCSFAGPAVYSSTDKAELVNTLPESHRYNDRPSPTTELMRTTSIASSNKTFVFKRYKYEVSARDSLSPDESEISVLDPRPSEQFHIDEVRRTNRFRSRGNWLKLRKLTLTNHEYRIFQHLKKLDPECGPVLKSAIVAHQRRVLASGAQHRPARNTGLREKLETTEYWEEDFFSGDIYAVVWVPDLTMSLSSTSSTFKSTLSSSSSSTASLSSLVCSDHTFRDRTGLRDDTASLAETISTIRLVR